MPIYLRLSVFEEAALCKDKQSSKYRPSTKFSVMRNSFFFAMINMFLVLILSLKQWTMVNRHSEVKDTRNGFFPKQGV